MSNAYSDWKRETECERKRCKNAVYCCHECGERWGTPVIRIYTQHAGKCEVCLCDGVAVTHKRNYRWLHKAGVSE